MDNQLAQQEADVLVRKYRKVEAILDNYLCTINPSDRLEADTQRWVRVDNIAVQCLARLEELYFDKDVVVVLPQDIVEILEQGIDDHQIPRYNCTYPEG